MDSYTKLLYFYLEQNINIDFLGLYKKSSEKFLNDLKKAEKTLIELKIEDLKIIEENVPINLPNIDNDIDLNNREEILNSKINKMLDLNHKFNYYLWRTRNDLNTINLNANYRMNKVKKIPRISDKVIEKLFKIYSTVSKDNIIFKKNNLIRINEFVFKCVSLPLSKKSYIILGKDTEYKLDYFYTVHEICHYIINQYKFEYELILTIEDEEYWVHLLEAGMIKLVLREEYYLQYLQYLKNLLIENKIETKFQSELFLNSDKYRLENEKKLLYKKCLEYYNVGGGEAQILLSNFHFLKTPFYSACYLNGQEEVLKIFKNVKLEDIIMRFKKTYGIGKNKTKIK
jgi:hypothetical protein